MLRPSSRPALTSPIAAAGALLLAGTLAACGDMTPPSSSSGPVTGSPAVGVEEGQNSSPAVPTTGTDVSGVIGSWAAQYGSARNQVLTAVSALASAGDPAAVKAAAKGALTAVGDAASLAPCPDAATESAFRDDLAVLRTRLEEIRGSGDAAAAADLASQAGTVFQKTEDALTAAYS